MLPEIIESARITGKNKIAIVDSPVTVEAALKHRCVGERFLVAISHIRSAEQTPHTVAAATSKTIHQFEHARYSILLCQAREVLSLRRIEFIAGNARDQLVQLGQSSRYVLKYSRVRTGASRFQAAIDDLRDSDGNTEPGTSRLQAFA